MKKSITEVPNGPVAKGPYALGVVVEGKLLFVSGQGPYNPKSGTMERGSIAEQTELTLRNVKAIVEAAGGRMENAVNCRVYLQPLTAQTFDEMNQVYRRFWGDTPPTRTTIGATLLNMDVEIDCVVAME